MWEDTFTKSCTNWMHTIVTCCFCNDLVNSTSSRGPSKRKEKTSSRGPSKLEKKKVNKLADRVATLAKLADETLSSVNELYFVNIMDNQTPYLYNLQG